MPVIAEYVRAYPEVQLDLRFSERFINLVEEGIELALRIGQLELSSLMARRIGTVRRYLVATPGLSAGTLDAAYAGRSDAHQCIAYSRLPSGQSMDLRIRAWPPRRFDFRFGDGR